MLGPHRIRCDGTEKFHLALKAFVKFGETGPMLGREMDHKWRPRMPVLDSVHVAIGDGVTVETGADKLKI